MQFPGVSNFKIQILLHDSYSQPINFHLNNHIYTHINLIAIGWVLAMHKFHITLQ